MSQAGAFLHQSVSLCIWTADCEDISYPVKPLRVCRRLCNKVVDGPDTAFTEWEKAAPVPDKTFTEWEWAATLPELMRRMLSLTPEPTACLRTAFHSDGETHF